MRVTIESGSGVRENPTEVVRLMTLTTRHIILPNQGIRFTLFRVASGLWRRRVYTICWSLIRSRLLFQMTVGPARPTDGSWTLLSDGNWTGSRKTSSCPIDWWVRYPTVNVMYYYFLSVRPSNEQLQNSFAFDFFCWNRRLAIHRFVNLLS